MKQILLLGFAALWVTVSMAQQGSQNIDKDTAKQQGGQLGTALNPGVTQGIKTGNPATAVPGYSANPAQKQYFQGGQGSTVGPGTTRVVGCTNQADVECQAVNLMQQGPQTRPQFNITRSDPLLGNSKNLTSNPTGVIGDIFSSYQTCKTTTTTTPPTFETQVCDEFSVIEGASCKMGQEVVVDPDYLYRCLETIQSQANATCTVGRVVQVDADYNYQCLTSPKKIETLVCNKVLIVTCSAPTDGCDTGGIVPGSTQGDMRVSFGGDGSGTYALEFGTFADNYWAGWATVFDRTLQFKITNKSSITQFSLAKAAFDDWLLLRLNGTTVYVGPRGGDRLEVVDLNSYTMETSPRSCQAYGDGYGGAGMFGCAVPRTVNDGYGGTYTLFEPDIWYLYCEPVSGGWRCTNSNAGPTLGVQYGPSSFSDPELKTSWNISLNLDLRPYLVEGANTLFMRTIVAGNGEGAIKINARMACPQTCTDNWDNQCASLEQRAQ